MITNIITEFESSLSFLTAILCGKLDIKRREPGIQFISLLNTSDDDLINAQAVRYT